MSFSPGSCSIFNLRSGLLGHLNSEANELTNNHFLGIYMVKIMNTSLTSFIGSCETIAIFGCTSATNGS